MSISKGQTKETDLVCKVKSTRKGSVEVSEGWFNHISVQGYNII